jgi:glucosylceramidase
LKGGISRWGWAQNSLVTVDPETNSYTYTYEYYVMKHYSHFIKPEAKRLKTSGYDNITAFANIDGSIVIVVGNQTNEDISITVKVGNRCITPTLQASSFNTFSFH